MTESLLPTESPATPRKLRTWLRTLLALGGFGIGLVIAWGSDRQAADATVPIQWVEPAKTHSSSAETFRIASFNIHGGKGTDRRLDLSRIAQELTNVDFAALFEVHATLWGTPANQAVELGNQLEMRSVFLGTENRWWHDLFGNAILTTRPLAGVQRIPLVGTRGKAFRQAVLVDLPFDGQTVHLVMVHVDSQQDREPQLAAVIRLFEACAAPAILMGDFNSTQDDPHLARLLSQPEVVDVLREAREQNAVTSTIDWIIAKGLTPVSATYGTVGASDHPVLKAELRLSESRAK